LGDETWDDKLIFPSFLCSRAGVIVKWNTPLMACYEAGDPNNSELFSFALPSIAYLDS